MRFSTTALVTAALATAASAIDIIGIKDRHFVNERTGDAFFMKGIDYQPGGSAAVERGSDPLSDPDACARDIFLFQRLEINTIRIYSIDPTLDHDECMTMLAAAGIYLVLDVNSPLENQHLHNTEPWTTYTPMYLEHIFQVIEVFSGYDNMLGFLAGNEVVHLPGSEDTVPPYLKALVRDMKAYIDNHIHRNIPVGYSNADNIEFRVSLAEYMSCGNVGNVDFWAINSYQWCGDNTFKGSGYDQLVTSFTNYSLPIFFSEYGCNEVRPRVFQEVAAIYSDDMTGVFSGGLVYEYTQEPADYGIVEVKSNGDIELLEEFETLTKANIDAGPGSIPDNAIINERPEECRDPETYWNINAAREVPVQLPEIAVMVEDGIGGSGDKWNKGRFVDVDSLTLETTHKITDFEGKEITDKAIEINASTDQEPIPDVPPRNSGSGSGSGDSPSGGEDDDSAAVSLSAFTFGTACIGAVAILFSAL